MSTLHYRPGPADMCDNAPGQSWQFAGALASGAEPLRRPRVGHPDIAAKKPRALERREVLAWTRHRRPLGSGF
jgi:hypothetical protein